MPIKDTTFSTFYHVKNFQEQINFQQDFEK